MKEYIFQKTSNFLNQGFKELKNFNFISSFDLYNSLIEQEKNISQLDNKIYSTHSQEVDVEQNWLKEYNQKRKVCRLRVKTDCPITIKSKYTYKASTISKNYVESDIFREDTIRSMYSPSLFLCLSLPYKFLLDNLQTNLDYTDLQLFYKEFKNVNLNSFKEIIDTVAEIDEKYPERTIIPGQQQPKTDDFFKWRSGILLNMLYSVYKAGFAYPLINTPTSSLLFDGTHRLSIAPIAKRDYPILLRIPPKLYSKIFYYITPNIFLDNKCCLLIIDSEQRNVRVKLLSLQETISFTKVSNYDETIKNLEIKDYEELNKFLLHLNSNDFDFIWNE